MRETPLLRQHCNPQVLAWIANKRCWHLDVWLYVDSVDVIYVKAQTSIAGHEVIGTAYFALLADAFGLYSLVGIESLPVDARETHINSPGMLKRLNSFQRSQIWHKLLYPLVQLRPRGDYPRRSVAFHCVKPVGVNDPCEGITNLYAETGRAARDATHGARLRKGNTA